MNRQQLWKRYQRYLCECPDIGLTLDVSRMHFDDEFLERMRGPMAAAIKAMADLEGGAIANPDENRMVGHYWLRNAELAPDEGVAAAVRSAAADVSNFAARVHAGDIKPQRGDGFYVVLHVGIGGSALGPQLLADALGTSDDPMLIRFIDNTDPDGIDRALGELGETIAETLTVVVSKSGGTAETRNGMMEIAAAYKRAGLDFAKHAVAITGEGSMLDRQAAREGWLARLPMWDWVGGRTSITSAVGLLPAALLGADVDGFVAGARVCDQVTREADMMKNPAALLALMWYAAGDGCGKRNMVVLPYADRLALFGRYLQQLVMESLGKRLDRDGREVLQGLTVYGNKGSTDQHSFIQQLRDGPDDFFATFIDVATAATAHAIEVEPGISSRDYLHAFLFGTRDALTDAGKQSMLLTLHDTSAFSLGALIALYERAVGLYAELINVNAYHQPGVEAGKKAAASYLDLQRQVGTLIKESGSTSSAEEFARQLGCPDDVELIEHILIARANGR